MSKVNRCFKEFREQSVIHVEANLQAAKKQQKLMYDVSRLVRRCATVVEAKALVNRKMQALFDTEVSVAGDDSEVHGWMVQSLKNRQVRLSSKLKRLAKERGATPAWIADKIRFHSEVMMLVYGHSWAVEDAGFSTALPNTFMDEFNRFTKAEMERYLKPALHCLSNIQKRDARLIACGERSLISKDLSEDWKRRYAAYREKSISRHHHVENLDMQCPDDEDVESLGIQWPDDEGVDPFTWTMDVEDMAETSEPPKNLINICNPEDVQNCLGSLKGNNKCDAMDKKVLQEMVDCGGMALHAPIPVDYKTIMADFRARFPNMTELAELIEGRFNLMTLGGDQAPAIIANNVLILDGAPGAGKTVAVKYLADRLGIGMWVLGFADMTNGFDVSGQSRGYGTGRMGHIARQLMRGKVANPFLVLDEIDKGSQDVKISSPYQPLYTLLERESAAHFRDEFLEFEIDASKINWLATSNYYERIPEPIRDRARRIRIQQPNEAQRLSIVGYLYQDLIAKNILGWGRFFSNEIDESVCAMLAEVKGISVRRLVELVEQCAIEAANMGANQNVEPGSVSVSEDDVAKVICRLHLVVEERQPIGFIH